MASSAIPLHTVDHVPSGCWRNNGSYLSKAVFCWLERSWLFFGDRQILWDSLRIVSTWNVSIHRADSPLHRAHDPELPVYNTNPPVYICMPAPYNVPPEILDTVARFALHRYGRPAFYPQSPRRHNNRPVSSLSVPAGSLFQ